MHFIVNTLTIKKIQMGTNSKLYQLKKQIKIMKNHKQ